MSVTDQFTVDYPATMPTDEELRRLTAEHPGIGRRTGPAVSAAKRTSGKVVRRVGRSISRGWARVRGCAGSLSGLGIADVAVFEGWGSTPGLIAVAASLVIAEWLVGDRS